MIPDISKLVKYLVSGDINHLIKYAENETNRIINKQLEL